MRIPLSVFIIFTLVLMTGYITGYGLFVDYFKNDRFYQAQLRQTHHKLEKQIHANELLTFQLFDLQQSIAQTLPQQKNIRNNLVLSNVSAVTRMPSSVMKVDFSSQYFNSGKKLFAERKYDLAIKNFEELIQKYPLSIYRVEGQFLTMESYFVTRQYGKSLQVIDGMVTQFPEHDLTGFALLRMGQILENHLRKEEALSVYQSVQTHFSNSELKKQTGLLINLLMKHLDE